MLTKERRQNEQETNDGQIYQRSCNTKVINHIFMIRYSDNSKFKFTRIRGICFLTHLFLRLILYH